MGYGTEYGARGIELWQQNRIEFSSLMDVKAMIHDTRVWS